MLAVTLLVLGEPVRAGISGALQVCGRVLLPSLFPFLVLAAYWSRRYRPSGKTSRAAKLLALPKECLPAVLLGWIGGYPVCAQCLRSLKKDTLPLPILQDVLNTCTSAGPAFIVTAVGSGMLGRSDLGLRLYGCHLLASLLLLLAGRKRRKSLLSTYESHAFPSSPPPSASACFVDSVTAAIQGILTMCGFVLLFSGVGNFLSWGLSLLPVNSDFWRCGLFSLLEVTAGAQACAENGRLSLLAFALGWGGCSVQLQILALLRELPISAGSFLRARLLHGLLSAGLIWGSGIIFPLVQPTFWTDTTPLRPSFFAGAPGCAALLLFCSIFLFSLSARRQKTFDNSLRMW